MSVINNMLRDLQSRQAPAAPLPGLAVTAPKRTAIHAYLVGLLIGASVLTVTALRSPPAPAPSVAGHIGLSLTKPWQPIDQLKKVAVSQPVKHKTRTKGAATPVAARAASIPQDAQVEALLEEAAPAAGHVEKKRREQTPQQQAQQLSRRATELAATGHGRQAVNVALNALEFDPSNVDVRQLAASLLYEQRRWDEAESLAQDGLKLAPQNTALAYLLARTLIERGQSPEALAVLDQQATLNADGLGLRASILSQSGDFKRAAQDYQTAVQQQPENSLWWVGLAVAMEALGQPDDARKVYAKAQSLGLERPELNAFVEQKLQALN